MTIHKWLGLLLSLWLLLITVTGTILLYKNNFLEWQYPQLAGQAGATAEQAVHVLQLDSITEVAQYSFLPTELHPWIEVIDKSGSRLYFSQSGTLLLEREKYGDWISWFTEFHHHLLLDDLGEELQGILGLLAILVFITGLIKWWPKGKFSKRDLGITWTRPGKKKWGQTLWQTHRTFGVILFLPMLLLIVTGVGMIYSSAFNSGLNYLFPDKSQKSVDYANIILEQNNNASNLPADWLTRIEQVAEILPEASTIMVYHQRDKLRLRQPEEWHPNGRSYLSFYPGSSKISEVTDYRNQTVGTQLSQKIYPLHIASVGGNGYLVLVTMSGIILGWICISGCWFWYWCRRKKLTAKKRKKIH